LPNFVGPWIPSAREPETRQQYCSSMLALMKPWRRCQDLLGASETWEEALEEFLKNPDSQIAQRFIDNVQFYHECRVAAQKADTELSGTKEPGKSDAGNGSDSEDEEVNEHEDSTDIPESKNKISEGDLEAYLKSRESSREQRHGERAVKIAIEAGIF
ncbi:hypothetical protein M378DRAFT_50033, partial [Amanita muscaria Koide BX008]